MQTLNTAGLKLSDLFEGRGPHSTFDRNRPYICPAGYLTIGCGHKIRQGEEKLYLGGMSLPEAKALYYRDIKQFLARTAYLTEAQVMELKRKDLSEPIRDLNAFMVRHHIRLNDNEFAGFVDVMFNGGSGCLQGATMSARLKSGDILKAIQWMAMFCQADLVKKGKKVGFGPITGLTFRRYSGIWLALTGEAWRIHDWQDVDIFLVKARKIVEDRGGVFELPYPRNRKEAQIA